MLWLVSCSAAVSATDDWVIRHFSTADGLPVSSASAASIDRDGFLWLATHDGLARFDGRRFEVFDMADHPAMGSNRIDGLYTDPLQRLYALTRQGKLLKVRANRIEPVVVDFEQPEAVIRRVDENPFCVTLSHGLFCQDESGNFQKRSNFDPDLNIRHALPGPESSIWLINASGVTWLHSEPDPMRLMRPEAPGVIPGTTSPLVLSDGSVSIAQRNGLIQIFADGREHFHKLPDANGENPLEITSLRRDEGMTLWVGTTRRLYRLNMHTGQWTHSKVPAAPGLSDGWTLPDGSVWTHQADTLLHNGRKVLVSDGHVQDVFRTDDGLVWVSTLRDGLYALSRPRVSVTDQRHGLQYENIYGVALDSDERLWLGSLEGEVQVLSDQSIKGFGMNEGLPGENPWAVIAAPDGAVYVATYHPGLYVLVADSEQFVAADLPEALAKVQVRALSIGPDQRLWIGGTDNVWRQDGASWQRFCANQLDDVTVLTIHHAPGGIRWYGTTRGLWREDSENCRAHAADQLGEFEIRDIHESADGALWASTQGHGLIRVQSGANQAEDPTEIVQIGRRQGLPSNSLHAVAEDHAGNLWVNSNQGVFRISRPELDDYLENGNGLLSPLVLTRADGLRDLEGNGGVQPAMALDSAGRIFFPSQSGLIGIDPENLSIRTRAPTAVIDSLMAGGIEHDLDHALQLPTGQRHVMIRFAAADLRGGPDRFRYRLVSIGRGGEESGWSEVVGQNATSFTALSPGTYRFEVVAGNNDGAWGTQAAAREFTVPAFWYETGLFRSALITLLVAGIGWMVFYRMQLLRRRATELNRQVDQRTRELSSEKTLVEQTLAQLADAHESLEKTHGELARRNRKLAAQTDRLQALDSFRKRLLADVSHELRTPLMLIDLPLAELDPSTGTAAAPLNETQAKNIALARTQTERLAHLVGQLVTLVQAESGQLDLKVRRVSINELILKLADSYRMMAQGRGIELHTEIPDPDLRVFADPDQMVSALGNLVDNAIKHGPDNSRIDIVQRPGKDEATIELGVIDQGPGFDAGLTERLFERFYREEQGPKLGREGLGIGLALAREIVQLHGGRIGARNRKQGGAEFWLELPLGSSHIALEDLDLESAPGSLEPLIPTDTDNGHDHVLLVEDHPELATYLADRLNEQLPTRTVSCAEDALEMLEKESFGLIISDIMLPGMSGLDMCHRLGDRDLEAPVILISARAGAIDRQAALDAGACELLVKPFELNDLFEAMETHWPPARKRLIQNDNDFHDDALMAPAVENLSNPDFGVDEWARSVHLSQRQLRRRVGELCGQSPLAWLREQRLLNVRKLISSGACQTLAEAGFQSGFDNPAYLYRLYRGRFGDN